MSEQKNSNWDLAKIAVVITAVSGLLAVLFGPGFLKDAIATPTPAPSATSAAPTTLVDTGANWTIAFQLTLPSGHWAVGQHTYTLETKCPGDGQSGKTTATFNVSESAEVLDAPVYLRPGGLYGEVFDLLGNVTSIHPNQKTVFSVVMLGSLTKADAEDLGAKCRVSAQWDSESPTDLQAGLPFLH